ncbi:MAG: nucleotidyltransferase family protein [Lentisphaerae bacterium]|nr:nucleotidyltransferase family protein [Lentisphaerota bacterium]
MKTSTTRPPSAPVTFELCRVRQDLTLLEALRAIEAGAAGIALVVDARARLVGTLTDGDARRVLLKGASLATPVATIMQRKFSAVPPEAGRADVLDLMRARLIDQIPVVDRRGRLVGLHLLHEVIGAEERPNVAVIMAGGRGLRLRPVTESIPKPMIRVAGRPILERVLLHLVSCGVRRVYISVNYLGHIIENHFGDGAHFGCQIDYVRERIPLGTGGALSLLKPVPRDPLIVMNGDLITQADIPAMLRFHATGRYVATMAVRRYGHQVPFGCVESKHGRMRRLEEKPVLERSINAGIYVINPPLLRRVPYRNYLITELFEECLKRGERVGAFEVEEEWIDVGQREQLKQGVTP